MTESSWENVLSLTLSLVQEFEEGNRREIQTQSFSSGGETVHILSTRLIDIESAPPKAKKVCEDIKVSCNSG